VKRKGIINFAASVGAGLGLAFLVRKKLRQMSRMDFDGKVVVITGGSRGLGLLLARRFAEEGARLGLIARDAGDLEQAAHRLAGTGADIITLACDVRDRAQVESALTRVIDRFGRIDVLVNNAGIIQVGPMEHMTLEDYQEAMDVHFWGPLYAILAVLPHMRQQGEGRVVNVASIGGEVAIPHLAPYVASKYALVGLSDALRAELAKDGIMMTTVVPGLMRTGSHVNALFKGNHRQEYTWFSVINALPIVSTDADKAAFQIVEACRYGEARQTITLQARLLLLLNHLFPGITAAIMKISNRLLPKYNPTHGYIARTGLESQSSLSPSALTALADLAAERNNELSGSSLALQTFRK
jgi:NAD(P)-dependent dehydrogenase (short-subunit alcohol dehydrogenase family)